MKRDAQRNGAFSISGEPHEENDWVTLTTWTGGSANTLKYLPGYPSISPMDLPGTLQISRAHFFRKTQTK